MELNSFNQQITRRGILGAGSLGALAFVLTACGENKTSATKTDGSAASSDSAANYPVIIKHAFGETKIEKQPTRVATVSWVNADVVVALGVIPVGMAEEQFGANANKSFDWRDAALEKLGAAPGSSNYPKQYSEADGINVQEIAALKPDLIVGAYSGMSEEDYKKLSAIAPTIAYPEKPWATSWQDSTTIIGKAIGKEKAASELIASVEDKFAQAQKDNPNFAGKTFISANLTVRDQNIAAYSKLDNRSKFFTELGFKPAPVVEEAEKAAGDSLSFFVQFSTEKADQLKADVLQGWVDDETAAKGVKTDPLLSKIPAVAADKAIITWDPAQVISISAASPLSLPYALDIFVPEIKKALN